jgi:hypothetical protein
MRTYILKSKSPEKDWPSTDGIYEMPLRFTRSLGQDCEAVLAACVDLSDEYSAGIVHVLSIGRTPLMI